MVDIRAAENRAMRALAAIMAVATGVLFAEGRSLDKILDMASTLEPVAGRFAVSFFTVGTLAAALVFSVATAVAGVKAMLGM